MYIFEIIAKFLKKLREKKSFSHNFNINFEENPDDECENHIYLPVDSTKEYLACKNCGHIIKNKKFF